MVSYDLLTQTATPSGAELAAPDRGALRVVQEWLGDARFARLGPHLQTMISMAVRAPILNLARPLRRPQGPKEPFGPVGRSGGADHL